MPELVGDIKKIDEDKIKEGREVLLKYLDEVDQETVRKTKPQEKKSLDSAVGKRAEVKIEPTPAIPARTGEAKIDFVKDFKSAESKFNKPITEIIHEVMDKPAPVAAAAPRIVPAPKPVNLPRAETLVVQKIIDQKPLPEKSRLANFFSFKNKNDSEIKKVNSRAPQRGISFHWRDLFHNVAGENKKKLKKIEQVKKEAVGKRAVAATDLIGRLFFKFFSAVTVLVILYFIFCLSLYTFGFDNGITRLITRIFPVPAFITQYGAVNYYDYLDTKNAIMNNQKDSDPALAEVLASIEAREKLIRRRILIGLARNYGLATNSLDSPGVEAGLENKLALLIVADPSINKDNLRKLRTIKSTLRGGADFILTANSFGLQSKIEYFNTDSIKEKFGQKALELAAGSTIETTSVKQGYYVFQFFNHQDGLTGFKYIFVPATTLEMMMAEKFKATDLIILTN